MKAHHLVILISAVCACSVATKEQQPGTSYYFSNAGDDAGDGSRAHPFRTLLRLQQLPLHAGDTFVSGVATRLPVPYNLIPA